MKTKKFFSILMMILCASILFAANAQKIYPIDSDLYQTIKQVYILTGHALPSTTGPWSAQELLNMYSEIEASEVPSFMKDKFTSALEELKETPEYQWKGIGASFNHEVNLELYAHLNNNSYTRTDVSGYTEQLFTGRSNWAYDLKNVTPTYRLKWETWVEDHAYSFFEFGLFNSYHAAEELGTTKLATNLLFFQNLKFDGGLIDANFPYRAFVSFGGEHWAAQIGRDRLSWGAGKTGNLTISDDLPYHNMGRFTAFSDKYKYTFLTSFFPNKMNYYNNHDGDCPSGYSYSGQNNGYDYVIDGILMYMAHRVEGRFLNDKLNLTLTEAIMYNSENNHLDLALLNPVFFYHNNYIACSSNSTLTFEADYTPFKGLNVYGQFLLDEFAVPGIEASAGPDNDDMPNAYGALAGATYENKILDGLFTINGEFAFIDPYTYLRGNVDATDQEIKDTTRYKYGLDYVVAVRQWSTSKASTDFGGITYDEAILGYQYGPDCMVANLNAGWTKGRLSLEANVLQMWHGTHDMWTAFTRHDGGRGEDAWKKQSVTCTSEHYTGNYRYSDAKDRDAVSALTDIGLAASYEFTDAINFYGQADFVNIKNAYNVEGKNAMDFQLVLGAQYEF